MSCNQNILSCGGLFNSLLNHNFWDLTKFKKFADNKLYIAEVMICLSDRVQKIAGTEENGGFRLITSIFFNQKFELCAKSLNETT